MYVTTHLLRFFGSLEAPPDEESDGIRGTPSVLSRFGSKLRLPRYADGRFQIPMTQVRQPSRVRRRASLLCKHFSFLSFLLTLRIPTSACLQRY